MKKLFQIISVLLVQRTVTAIGQNSSIFAQRIYKSSSAPPNITEYCKFTDSTFTSEICSTDNSTFYSYTCTLDAVSRQCSGNQGSPSQGISSYLNLTSFIKNTSYSGRSDFDLSSCKVDQNLYLTNCSYLISGIYVPPPVNTTNTTAQLKPYSKFCTLNQTDIANSFANNVGFTQNCTSNTDLQFAFVQYQTCTAATNGIYSLANCQYTGFDGSIFNQTIYLDTLTVFTNNQRSPIVDVLQSVSNSSGFIQYQYVLSYNQTLSQQISPFVCTGSITNMKQTCSNDSLATQIEYNCYFNIDKDLVCQQENINSTSLTQNETKYTVRSSGLQYVQYGQSLQITVRYCMSDYTTLNQNCITLYTFYQTDVDYYSKTNITLSIENTASSDSQNYNVYWQDYYGNLQFFYNLQWGYVYQQQAFSGDTWVILNANDNSTVFNYVAQNRSQYLKIPASYSLKTNLIQTSISFTNQLEYQIQVNLLNNYNQEITQTSLKPGDKFTQGCSVGTQYIIRNNNTLQELFSYFSSQQPQSYNVTQTAITTVTVQQIKSLITNQVQITCVGSQSSNIGLQICSELGNAKNIYTYNCTQNLFSIFCTAQIQQNQQNITLYKLTLLQSNVSFISSNVTQKVSVHNCNSTLVQGVFNQSCLNIYAIYVPKNLTLFEFYQLQNTSYSAGVLLSQQQNISIKVYKKVSGQEFYTIFNQSKQESQCSFLPNGFLYCTTDKTGLNFSQRNCSINYAYNYIGCQLIGQVQCQSLNTSGCIYSIYYDKDYDWDTYQKYLQIQNQLLSNLPQKNQAVIARDPYRRLQLQIFYNSSNYLSQSVDEPYGDICFTMDQVNCLNPTNAGVFTNGTYCYTYNGFSCYLNYGNNCNLQTGINCATYDGVNLANLTTCATNDQANCISDRGDLCASQNLLNCNITIDQSTCQTLNGVNCYQFRKGWKFTQDGASSYFLTTSNGQPGWYCFTFNGDNCGRNYITITNQDAYQCVTNDYVNCYQDIGKLCNTTQQNWCNMNNNLQSCPSYDMKGCILGFWILSSKSADLSGNSSYCYSADGSSCKSFTGGSNCQNGNSLSTYLCMYQYNQAQQLYSSNLQTLSQCISYDNINCFSDLQSNCADPNKPGNPFCKIQVSTQFCLTSNKINCLSFGPGWYFTYDGKTTSSIFPSSFNQIGSYCFSSNGIVCDATYGQSCDSYDGSNCASVDRVNPVKMISCIQDKIDFTKCLRDLGQLCKPAPNNYDGSCGLQQQISCLSFDKGIKCQDLVSGWYYSQDGLTVYQSNFPNGLIGKYCFSQDGKTCYINYDPQCSITQDKFQCLNTTRCISLDGSLCYYDSGALCNSTGRLSNICNIKYQSSNCTSKLADGVNCYSQSVTVSAILSGGSSSSSSSIQTSNQWCFSLDGNICSFDDQSTVVGIYCQTLDGFYCFRDYGPNCDVGTGYLCSTSDRVNLDTVAYCASYDGMTCVSDQGQFCGQKRSQYCKITQTKFCITNDNTNCYEFLKRWYFTLDQKNVYQGSLSKKNIGSYCYSYDGVNCKNQYQTFISGNLTNCITQNNQTCFSDQGSLCASPEQINYCFISNSSNNCPTFDGVTCSNMNWIKRRTGSSLCYSVDGQNCQKTLGGIYCKSNSDYLCSYLNGQLQQETVCLSYDQQYCYNCTIQDTKQCFQKGDTKNYCNTVNGVNCINLVSGWYYTYDGLDVSNLPQLYSPPVNNGVPGFYCYSQNSYTCNRSYGTNCSLKNGKDCAKSQSLNYIYTSKCISQDNQNCFRDQGGSCAPIRKNNPGGSCDLNPNQLSCDINSPQGNCYDYLTGWYFTVDGLKPFQNQSLIGQIAIGSYCFSKNGTTCFQNNGTQCNYKTGYKCSTTDRLNPQNIEYCISQDNKTCYQDVGTLCNQTGDLSGRCNIYNNSNNCQTFDGKTCYINLKGWYVTFNGLNVDFNQQSKQNLLRGYCYSEDGTNCKQNYGPSCNPATGYFCTTSDGVTLSPTTYCLTSDNQTCFQDYGLLCNYTDKYAWCNINNASNSCSTLDGILCYKFIPGWYYTLDYIKVSPNSVSTQTIGSYCYSNDGINCYSDYGPSCDPLTGYMCTTTDGINPYQVNYCISDDNVNCKQDSGQFCNFTGQQQWCNINFYVKSCMTMFRNNKCFNLLQRWQLTYDGINTNQILLGNNGFLASYCYSRDGQTCTQNYGESCNPVTGVQCSTLNGANLQLGSYCITQNSQTCFKDVGQLCNDTGQLNWCNIKNQTSQQYCFTQDGLSCFNSLAQYCFTFDGYNCTTQSVSNNQGTYCWSDSASVCTKTNVTFCNQSIGSVCVPSNATQTFCITQDNITCLVDTGYYCNNTYDLTSCNINYDLTQFCLTNNSLICMKKDGDPIKNQTIDVIQRRNFRNFFFYAIQGNVTDVQKPGICDSSCAKMKDMCCVSVKRQAVGGLVLFDNLCMNQYVAQSQINVQLYGFSYVLNCVQVKFQQTKALIIKSYAIATITLSTLALYLISF